MDTEPGRGLAEAAALSRTAWSVRSRSSWTLRGRRERAPAARGPGAARRAGSSDARRAGGRPASATRGRRPAGPRAPRSPRASPGPRPPRRVGRRAPSNGRDTATERPRNDAIRPAIARPSGSSAGAAATSRSSRLSLVPRRLSRRAATRAAAAPRGSPRGRRCRASVRGRLAGHDDDPRRTLGRQRVAATGLLAGLADGGVAGELEREQRRDPVARDSLHLVRRLVAEQDEPAAGTRLVGRGRDRRRAGRPPTASPGSGSRPRRPRRELAPACGSRSDRRAGPRWRPPDRGTTRSPRRGCRAPGRRGTAGPAGPRGAPARRSSSARRFTMKPMTLRSSAAASSSGRAEDGHAAASAAACPGPRPASVGRAVAVARGRRPGREPGRGPRRGRRLGRPSARRRASAAGDDHEVAAPRASRRPGRGPAAPGPRTPPDRAAGRRRAVDADRPGERQERPDEVAQAGHRSIRPQAGRRTATRSSSSRPNSRSTST